MGPTWVLSAACGPHVGPINLAIWGVLTSMRKDYHCLRHPCWQMMENRFFVIVAQWIAWQGLAMSVVEYYVVQRWLNWELRCHCDNISRNLKWHSSVLLVVLVLLVQNAMSLVPNDILVKNYGQLTLEELQLVNAAISSYTADIMGMAEWCPTTMAMSPLYFMMGMCIWSTDPTSYYRQTSNIRHSKSHNLKCFSPRLVVVFAPSTEARC